MSNVCIQTRGGQPKGPTPTQGTKVLVGNTPVDMVTQLELVAEKDGVWTLKISVAVDPAKLFVPLPDVDEIEITHLGSESRQYVAGKAA